MKSFSENIGGYNVFAGSVNDCIADIFNSINVQRNNVSSLQQRWLACINPHSYAVSLQDAEFAHALHNADWLVPDGVGIVCASKFIGGRICGRLTGSDIFNGVNEKLNHGGGYRIFLLGSTDDVLDKICNRLKLDFPNLTVAGTYSPPFKISYNEEELDFMVDIINRASPDVLWVGMTAPKQEKWIFGQLYRLNVKFAAGVGAVFDFYSGRVKRSHPLFQMIGLEWLPRLIQEPRRLWRRVFISAPIFFFNIIKIKLKGD